MRGSSGRWVQAANSPMFGARSGALARWRRAPPPPAAAGSRGMGGRLCSLRLWPCGQPSLRPLPPLQRLLLFVVGSTERQPVPPGQLRGGASPLDVGELLMGAGLALRDGYGRKAGECSRGFQGELISAACKEHFRRGPQPSCCPVLTHLTHLSLVTRSPCTRAQG